ncbi:MAG: hypothetical protein HYY23_19665, partial [Verrucomicrobia bacterium]|nr:hypothetical protein [Verrucomicrobiota bacterium]
MIRSHERRQQIQADNTVTGLTDRCCEIDVHSASTRNMGSNAQRTGPRKTLGSDEENILGSFPVFFHPTRGRLEIAVNLHFGKVNRIGREVTLVPVRIKKTKEIRRARAHRLERKQEVLANDQTQRSISEPSGCALEDFYL